MVGNTSYVHIGWWMINELGLGGTELLVYAVIYSFTNGTDDHCFHGSALYLSEWVWVSKRHILTVLKNLEERWLITRIEKVDNWVKFVSYFTGDEISSSGGYEKISHGGDEISSSNNNRVDKERENNNYTRQNKVLTEKEKKFEEFWSLYPKKKQKKNSLKVFNRIDPKEYDNLINGLMAQVDYWRRKWQDKQYIPDPNVWLNGERWNDEIEDGKMQKKVVYNRMPDVSKMSMDELKAFTWLK